MNLIERALAGDAKAIDKVFFNSKGGTRSDDESDIVFNTNLPERERVRRIAILREAKFFTKPQRTAKVASKHVPFDVLVGEFDAYHARAFGVRLD